MTTTPVTLEKTTQEDERFEIDFSSRLGSGETISSVIAVEEVTTSDLTIGAPVHDSTKVQVFISGGVHNTTYTLSVRVITTTNPVVEERPCLFVSDKLCS